MNNDNLFIFAIEDYLYFADSLNLRRDITITQLSINYYYNFYDYMPGRRVSLQNDNEVMLFIEPLFYHPVANNDCSLVVQPTNINSSLHVFYNEKDHLQVKIETQPGNEGVIHDQLKASYCMIQEYFYKNMKKKSVKVLYHQYMWFQTFAYKINNETNFYINNELFSFKVPFDDSNYTKCLADVLQKVNTEKFDHYKNLSTTIINDKNKFPVFNNPNFSEGFDIRNTVRSEKVQSYLRTNSLKIYFDNTQEFAQHLYENKIITEDYRNQIIEFTNYNNTNEHKLNQQNPILEQQDLERRMSIAMDRFRLEIQGLIQGNVPTINKALENFEIIQTNKLQTYNQHISNEITAVKKEIKDIKTNVTNCNGRVTSSSYDTNVLISRTERVEKIIKNLDDNIANINREIDVLNNKVDELNNKVDELNDVVQGLENNETAPRIKKRSTLGRVYNYIRSWFWSDTVETIIIPDNAQDINNNNNQAVDQRSMLRKIRDFFFYNPFRN